MMLKTPQSPVFHVALYLQTKPVCIDQNTVASNSFGRGLFFEGDTRQYKNALVWYYTGSFHTVQERALPCYRVRGTRYVSCYELHA